MAREAKFPPTIHRHKSNQAFIRWKGREYYLGPFGSPQAKAKYLRIITQIQAGRTPQTNREAKTETLSVANVVQAWWEQEAPRISDRSNTRDRYRLSLEPLLAMFGPLPAADLDANCLEEVQLAMTNGSWLQGEDRAAREKRCNRGPLEWCRKVVNSRVTRIKAVWRWATKKGLVPPNNIDTIRGLKANDARVRNMPKVKAASGPDLAAVLTEAPRMVAMMLRLMYWSGMRPGEVRSMRHGEIDRGGTIWTYTPGKHKNDWRESEQSRVVVLGPTCQAVLRWWWRLSGGEGPADAFVFPSPIKPGEPMGDDSFGQAARRAAERAGVFGFHPYRCRHSAKRRVSREMGLDVARAFLGQRSITTTNSYDEQVDLGLASEAAKKLG